MGCTNSALRENGTAKAGCPTSGAPNQGEPAIPLYNSTQPYCAGSGPVCSDDVVEQPADLRTLDDHYVRHVSDFLALHAAGGAREGRPFFAYVPFSHVHVPLSHNPRFQNQSKRNTLFADTLLEMDDTFGRIMAQLEELKLDEDTLVLVVGDNGPWNAYCDDAGSQGPFTGEWLLKQVNGSKGEGFVARAHALPVRTLTACLPFSLSLSLLSLSLMLQPALASLPRGKGVTERPPSPTGPAASSSQAASAMRRCT
jgi:hypothetical protein